MNKNSNKVQLFNKGDILYKLTHDTKSNTYSIYPVVVEKVEDYDTHFIYRTNKNESIYNRTIGRTYFTTFKEATDYKTKLQINSKKRALLKEYEQELNKKFGIETNIIK